MERVVLGSCAAQTLLQPLIGATTTARHPPTQKVTKRKHLRNWMERWIKVVLGTLFGSLSAFVFYLIFERIMQYRRRVRERESETGNRAGDPKDGLGSISNQTQSSLQTRFQIEPNSIT